jgi:hypothetical protein
MLPVFQVKPAILAQPPATEPLEDPPELLLELELELELLDPPELLELLDPELLDDELALPPPLLLPPPPEELELLEPTPLDEPVLEPLLDEPEPLPPPASSPPALEPLSHAVEDESELHPLPAARAKNTVPNETAIASLFITSLSKLGTTGLTRPPLT